MILGRMQRPMNANVEAKKRELGWVLGPGPLRQHPDLVLDPMY
jgi:hypothetical protein